MFRRATIATVITLSMSLWGVRAAAAQDLSPKPLRFAAADAAAAVAPAPLMAEAPAREALPSIVRSDFDTGHSSILNSLYVSTALVHAFDVHSTYQVLHSGGAEGNPMLSGLVSKPAAFIAFKAGIAATSIMAARQIAKHNKVAAALTLVAINSAYAMVVSHNYKLARQLNGSGF